MNDILNDVTVCNNGILMVGDLNIDLAKLESSPNDVGLFMQNVFSYHFIPLITKPTRFPLGEQHGSPSILDHIWFNKCNVVQSGIIIFDATDHFPTFAILKDILLLKNALVKIVFRDKSVNRIERFVCASRDLAFDLSGNDVNIDTNMFIKAIDDLYCKSFPLKTKYVSCKRLSKPWLTSSLLKCIKNISNYYKKFEVI